MNTNTETFDFEDGKGPVPAHKHSNGGGWVANTAHVDSTAFVGPSARVFGDAGVSGDAEVYGNAEVSGNAEVYGNARVCGDSWVSGNAWVSENAWVFGNAEVSGNARVFGNAEVFGNARVFGNAEVSGDTVITNGFHTKTKGRDTSTQRNTDGTKEPSADSAWWGPDEVKTIELNVNREQFLALVVTFGNRPVDCNRNSVGSVWKDSITPVIDNYNFWDSGVVRKGIENKHEGAKEFSKCFEEYDKKFGPRKEPEKPTTFSAGTRSDGYEFIGHVKKKEVKSNGSHYSLWVKAGCRDFNFTDALNHWSKTRMGTPLGDETFALLSKIKAWYNENWKDTE